MSIHDLTVSDLMTTALVTVKSKDTVKLADLDMRLAEIRHIPIVDDRNRLVGIVSNRDLFRVLGKRGGRDVAVKDIMTTRLYTAREDTPAADACAMMIEHKIGALPVLNEDEELVGIVTETDMLRVAHQALTRG